MGKKWQAQHLLSLAGVYQPAKEIKKSKVPAALTRFLKEYPEVKNIVFHLDGYAEPGDEMMSAPYEIFDCGYAPYFYEAVRQRYPEYYREFPPVKEKSAGKER